MSDLALVNCAQLVTCAGPARPRVGPEMGELFVLKGVGLLAKGGVITDIDHQHEIERRITPETRVIDCKGCVVLPGFVDAHAHPVFAGNRIEEFEMRSGGASYERIAAAGGGIWSTVQQTRAAAEDDLVESGRRHLSWALKCGTTTMEAKSGYGLSLADEAKILQAIKRLADEGPVRLVPTFLGAHSVPPGSDRDEYVQSIRASMLPAVVEAGLAGWCDVFCEPTYFDVERSRQILVRAKELGLGLRVHADQLTLSGGAKLAAEVGAKTADHLEQTDLDGIRAMQRAGVQPVLLPGSVYALGKAKYPLARTMVEEGLAVVLASDFNPGSSPTPSIPMVLSLACTQLHMSPAEAIIATTVNAAHSLNLGHKIGSLEPGKRCDFSVFEWDDFREIAYWFGAQQARTVVIEGKIVWGQA